MEIFAMEIKLYTGCLEETNSNVTDTSIQKTNLLYIVWV